MALKRFGVSLDEKSMQRLDNLVIKERFPNRSQAIKFLVNNQEVKRNWNDNQIVTGSIVLVYDHHKREIQKQLTQIQHDYHCLILASQHVHLDHHNCLETIAVKGEATKLTKLSDKLKAVKGIKHGGILMSSID